MKQRRGGGAPPPKNRHLTEPGNMKATANAATRRAGAICSAIAMFAMTPVTAQTLAPQVLGSAPLCEASAALLVDCPGTAGRCLLVGDNEEEASLFWFKLGDKGIDPTSQRAVALKDARLGDIEALAGLANGKIVAFGSHSRDSVCAPQKKRQRFGVIDRLTGKSATVAVTESGPIDCNSLFGQPLPDQPLIRSACQAIEAAEKAAEKAAKQGAKAKKECNQAHAYNAEGAVNVSRTGAPDIWIGLRAPLLPHPAGKKGVDLAMLLHLRGLDAYAFDRVAALDLGGFGVRELSYADGWVWVIAGPPHDLGQKDEVRSKLMRFRSDLLGADKIIVPETFRSDLPSSSEGLAVLADKILVLIDGSKATKEQPDRCATPAGVVVLPRPASAMP